MADDERVVQNLNAALHSLLERDDRMYLIGQDIADPYGGAFGVTRGLSTRYPERVISAPISEAAMVGAANGLALAGDRVIVELMFGDFVALAFDQILNFTAKSVAMYGRSRPMQVLVRCPVGGNRGYGPTHSQSLQKHLIGIPNLSLHELSPFHDAAPLLDAIFSRPEPAILFEPKTLYPRRVCREGKLDDLLACRRLGGSWVHVAAEKAAGPVVVILAPGGMADRAMDAARALAVDDAAQPHILIPSQLYPLDLRPVAEILASATVICVAEESTAGGTWGTEVAARVHEMLWDQLASPVLLVNSRSSVIPAAPHLERQVLVQAETITAAVRSALGRSPRAPRATAATKPGPARPPAPLASPGSISITIPKLNNNDTSYVLLNWLVGDGQEVAAGSPIAEIETSKAVEELAAEAAGILRVAVPAGAECQPGDVIAHLDREPGDVILRLDPEQDAQLASHAGNGEVTTRDRAGMEPLLLSRAQLQVSHVVTASHRDIPAAFVVVKANIDALRNAGSMLAAAAGGPVGLLEVLVTGVARLRPRFPACFCTLVEADQARVAGGAHIAVTLDAGNGLYLPVIRSADLLSAADIADQLTAMRMKALRGTFTESDQAGANIAISWNNEPGVTLVQPLIPPGLACAVSVSGTSSEIGLTPQGTLAEHDVVSLGLAHDHRLVNGREAASFLRELAAILSDEQALAGLIRSGTEAPDRTKQR
jgi:pyruvate/2-oxoglutarate/acetoin dehydrogenase E1 component/pyruvate/2-oxoglutarate dehydrogenase complex dihydrolipoamide acyltransferase (E2) component